MSDLSRVLEVLTSIPGVRGALVVSREDGLVVAESAMNDVDSAAVSALSASLAARLARAVRAAGLAAPRGLLLEASHGSIMAAPAEANQLLVVVTGEDANLGLLRLALRDAAERLG